MNETAGVSSAASRPPQASISSADESACTTPAAGHGSSSLTPCSKQVDSGESPHLHLRQCVAAFKPLLCILAGHALLFKLPSAVQDCILQRLRPIDIISLRLSCRAGLERLRGHLHLKFMGTAADLDCWQRLTTEATHVSLCGVIPTFQQFSNLMPQMPVLPALSNLVSALSNLVVLVVQPHCWPLGTPVYVTFSSWAHLPQLQLEVWSADQDKSKLSAAIGKQPLMMPSLLENPLSCQAQNALVLVNHSEQPTKVVWCAGVDRLWIVSYGHMQIVQVSQADLLQGVRQVCIAYPCSLSNGEAGELNIIALSSTHPTPVHCSFDVWLDTAETTLEQLALERFVHFGMNFIVSQGCRDSCVQKYSELTKGVYVEFASTISNEAAPN